MTAAILRKEETILKMPNSGKKARRAELQIDNLFFLSYLTPAKPSCCPNFPGRYLYRQRQAEFTVFTSEKEHAVIVLARHLL
ncbi:hypothetical protein NPIL_20461 [Nephila pilipes]|uniref:Uncharacterized protein n=1 Tax=Nephila pilipes TaxID=299642 RepID=A0A8X6P2T0_NEPPI|nr:hypothetical protein NPIL_20461 [Nephila pilipes]